MARKVSPVVYHRNIIILLSLMSYEKKRDWPNRNALYIVENAFFFFFYLKLILDLYSKCVSPRHRYIYIYFFFKSFSKSERNKTLYRKYRNARADRPCDVSSTITTVKCSATYETRLVRSNFPVRSDTVAAQIEKADLSSSHSSYGSRRARVEANHYEA